MTEASAIQSVKNSMVKYAFSLKVPKRLKESEDFFCEGFHLVTEALDSGLKIRFVFFTREAESRPEGGLILKKAAGQKIRCLRATAKVFSYLTEMESPQGLAAIVQKPVLQWPAPKHALVLGAYQVQDPGNLGTLFRSAEAFGATGLLLAGGCCDPFNPKAVRASMGSLFRLPFKKEEDWEGCFRGLRSENFRIFALASQGERSLLDMTVPERSAFWVGSEGAGLPEALSASCDEKVRIPMDGKVESLNAGVAASLALFCARFKGRFLDAARDR